MSNVSLVDDYTGDEKIHTFTDVYFRTSVSRVLKWQTQVAVKDNKIINISNKIFSFFTFVWKHPQFQEYFEDIRTNYNSLLITQEGCIVVEEPVFQFFDLESVCGSGHSYDVMFHFLYAYCYANLICKLLVPKSENMYYQRTLQLIRDEFGVSFYEIDPEKTYLFKEFSCVRGYQNVYFHHVKEFINKRLIQPIVKRFEAEGRPFYSTVAKMKFHNNPHIFWPREVFEKTAYFDEFCKEKKILNLDEEFTEQEKIYYLNKADRIMVCWGSTFFINITYYVANHESKFISVIFHKTLDSENGYIHTISPGFYRLALDGFCGGYQNQLYTKFTFHGELIHGISNIDDALIQTKI